MGKKLINPERLYDGAPLGMSQAVLGKTKGVGSRF